MSKQSEINTARFKVRPFETMAGHGAYEKYFETKSLLPADLFVGRSHIWLEVGAGTGWFFTEMAKLHPETYCLAIERCKMRGRRLVKKTEKAGLTNLTGFRGNAIPALMHTVPAESIDRLYILYPCPWPKSAQRRNRWYLHPVMPHLLRILKPDGLLIWASDQKFYIDEAKYVSEACYPLKTLAHGPIAPNPYNGLEPFPEGRTKFERTFLAAGQPCYELVSRKVNGN